MILIGLDDTDTLESPGTNQVARHLIRRVARWADPVFLLRHQLLRDPRVPFTSQNGSASIWLLPRSPGNSADQELLSTLWSELRAELLAQFVEGSDPGLAIAVRDSVDATVRQFGKRCQTELVTQQEAATVAAAHGIRLEGLGGTHGGVIGALAAIGLAAEANDGRVVVQGTWADDWGGIRSVQELAARDVLVRELNSGRLVTTGTVDVGKKLRPNLRLGRVVLFVESLSDRSPSVEWRALKLT